MSDEKDSNGEFLNFNNLKAGQEKTRVDFDRVKGEIRGRVQEIVTSLYPEGKIKRGKMLIGDIEGSPGNSMSIQLNGDKAGLWHDFATGEGGDIFDLWAAFYGLDSKTQFPEIIKQISQSFNISMPEKKDMVYFDELGPKMGEWRYTDGEGNLIATVTRYEPTDGKKEFRPWDVVNRKTAAPNPRPLYNQLGIKESDEVILVEGEKCADALISKGICATTAMNGAKAPIESTDWAPLKGKKVFIWPDNDFPGREYASSVAAYINNTIADSVSIIEVEKSRPKGWDAADAIEEEENIHDLLKKWKKRASPAPDHDLKPVFIENIFDLSPPPRDWIFGNILSRKNVTMLVSPGGVGKSTISIQIALAVSAGMDWAGWNFRDSDEKGKKRGVKSWVINNEDPQDELHRRVKAAMIAMKIDPKKVKGKIALHSGENYQLMVSKKDALTKSVKAHDDVDRCIEYIKRNEIGVLIVDPFIETFEGDENDNVDMIKAVGQFRKIAREANCAVLIIHHAGKSSDSPRGASSLMGAVRASFTLAPMTEDESFTYNVTNHKDYVRWNDAKNNLSALSNDCRWFLKAGIDIDNASNGRESDEIGVLIPEILKNEEDNNTHRLIADIATVLHNMAPEGGAKFRLTHTIKTLLTLNTNYVGRSEKWIADTVARAVKDEISEVTIMGNNFELALGKETGVGSPRIIYLKKV